MWNINTVISEVTFKNWCMSGTVMNINSGTGNFSERSKGPLGCEALAITSPTQATPLVPLFSAWRHAVQAATVHLSPPRRAFRHLRNAGTYASDKCLWVFNTMSYDVCSEMYIWEENQKSLLTGNHNCLLQSKYLILACFLQADTNFNHLYDQKIYSACFIADALPVLMFNMLLLFLMYVFSIIFRLSYLFMKYATKWTEREIDIRITNILLRSGYFSGRKILCSVLFNLEEHIENECNTNCGH